MSTFASILTCKCCRPAPWKKCVRNLYPPQSTGYEDNLEAQNAEELAKLALRNDKLFAPISKTLEKNITRDLRKQKYGYVSVTINTFITIIDMCHDNLRRFEASVYNVLKECLNEDHVPTRIAAMNLFIKVCQCKEQDDDSTNGKYFDFLDSILEDCTIELETPSQTYILYDTAISVLYQLVLICPGALITTTIPKLVPVLVNVIHLENVSKDGASSYLKSMKTNAARCLSNIYPLVNVITSSALLTPLFRTLDSYGWYPLSFAYTVIRTLTGNKNRETYSKPAYLNILFHITELLPELSSSDDFSHEESLSRSKIGLNNAEEVELPVVNATPRRLAIVRCILACVENRLQEARSISMMHEQTVTDYLLSLLHYLLQQAIKYGATLPIECHASEPQDPLQYSEVANTEEMQSIILQTVAACKQCILVMARTVNPGSEYFDILESVIFLHEEAEEAFKHHLLVFAYEVTQVRYLQPLVPLPTEIIRIVLSGLITPQDDMRLLWFRLLESLVHSSETEVSEGRCHALRESPLAATLLQSLFISTNTEEHYKAIESLVATLLDGDTQSVLEVIIPALFHAQSITTQKLDIADTAEPLLQYINSAMTLSSSSAYAKLSTPLPSTMSNMFLIAKPLDTVVSEEEEDEEETVEESLSSTVEGSSEIHLTATEIKKHEEELSASIEIMRESPEVILLDNEEEPEGYSLPRPSGQLAHLYASQLVILEAVGKAVRSEDLLDYAQSIQTYRLQYQWPFTPSLSEDIPNGQSEHEMQESHDAHDAHDDQEAKESEEGKESNDNSTSQTNKTIQVVDDEVCDGTKALIHKEVVVQFILRSPYLLSSQVPNDFADILRRPITEEELELSTPQDSIPRMMRRLSSVSYGSETSFRNSVRDSDSEIGDIKTDGVSMEEVSGSQFLCEHPDCTFEEIREKLKELQEMKPEVTQAYHPNPDSCEESFMMNRVIALILLLVC